MKNFKIALSLLAVILLSSFIYNPFVSEKGTTDGPTKKMDAFTSIEVSIKAVVKVTAGDRYDVSIDASEADLKNIISKVEDGHLILKKKKGSKLGGDVLITITANDIEALILSGSGKIVAKSGVISDDEGSIVLAGSGEISVSLDGQDKMEAVVAGSGTITLKGQADRLTGTVSGSGDIIGSELKVSEAEIVIAGSGDCSITVKSKLNAVISGSGDIVYHGDPEVNKQVLGSGEVRKK
jgi:hypothetical protein